MQHKGVLRGGLALLLASGLMLVGCSAKTDGSSDTGATGGDTLTIAIGAAAASWDPALQTGGETDILYNSVWDTLVHPGDGMEIKPGVATEWSYNDDNTVLTMKLREGQKFTSGNPVNAEAAKATLERSIEAKGANASILAQVDHVEAPDDLTLEIHLKQPDPGLLYYLTNRAGIVADPASFDADVAEDPVGSGPYMLDKQASTTDVEYVMQRNEDYWNLEEAAYKTVKIKVISDPTAMLNALQSGGIDWGAIGANQMKAAEQAGLKTYEESPRAVTELVLGDREGTINPAIANQKVRQAINLAIDRESIVKNLFYGYGVPTQQLLPEGTIGYSEDAAHRYDFNIEKAKQLMQEAGYGDGFELVMPSTSETAVLEPALTDTLGKIGIAVKWEAVPVSQYFQLIGGAKWAVFYGAAGVESNEHDISFAVEPNSLYNPFHSTTPELAALLEAGRVETDEAKRGEIYREISDYVVDQAWLAPILFQSGTYAMNDTVDFHPIKGVIKRSTREFSPAS